MGLFLFLMVCIMVVIDILLLLRILVIVVRILGVLEILRVIWYWVVMWLIGMIGRFVWVDLFMLIFLVMCW